MSEIMDTNTTHTSTDNMIPYLYGEFTTLQTSEQKKLLQRAIFWCLLYKDPDYKDKYAHVNVDTYFNSLLLRLGGLNELFSCPPAMVTLQSVLQAARDEQLKNDFDWHTYRKLILDAEKMIDDLFMEGDE